MAPHYLKIHDILLEEIRNHTFPPGMMLPSETALARRFDISRPTLRKALRLLASENHLSCRTGVGWSVNLPGNPALPKNGQLLTFATDVSGAFGTFYSNRILTGAHHKAGESGVCLKYLPDRYDPEAAVQDGVDGLLLCRPEWNSFPRLQEIDRGGIPVILLDRMPPQATLSYLAVDYALEARRAVEYLLLLGHRDIAAIGLDPTLDPMQARRYEGYEQAFQEASLPVPYHLFHHDKQIFPLVEFLERERPSALFITGGGWMLVTLLALERLRLRIGEDLSVICFDDMSEYELLDTPVSHIHMPLRKMGETAIDYLVRRCRGGSIPPLRETMDADLVINRSCRRFQPHL